MMCDWCNGTGLWIIDNNKNSPITCGKCNGRGEVNEI